MKNLKQLAYDVIKQRIVRSEYKANEFLDEKSIAEELKASRTPVREAMIILAQEGYLKIIPKRGIMVLPFSDDDVLSIFEVRELVEPWLVRTYGSLITRDELFREKELLLEEVNYKRDNNITQPGFALDHHPHTLFISKCTNKYILNLIQHIEEQSQRIPSTQRAPKPRQMTDEQYSGLIDRHTVIIDVMLEGDLVKTEELVRAHIERARRSYMNYWFQTELSEE